MRKLTLTISITCSLFIIGCKNEKTSTNTQKEIKKAIKTQETESSKTFTKYYKSEHKATGYSFFVESKNGETSTINLFTKGGATNFNESIEIEGVVLSSFMTDINKDGFKEFFIKILPTDDSGNLELIGYASNKGKSISQIFVRKIDAQKEINSDKLTITENEITREFKENGITKKYNYQLVEGEAGYQLEPRVK
ncbi:MAG: hypothetical protein HWD85_04680 [Flavobacteriaceae bacterium]|nr:hypothetical protein [Flavobacteriaceae bacterium]